MALIDRNSVRVIAESMGLGNLSDELAAALAPDLEFRLRDIVQNALKFMRHGKRTTLSTDDINYALRLRQCEPLYGFAFNETPHFCRAAGAPDEVFFLDDPELNLADLSAAPLPSIPREPSFSVHWLAVNGVQPNVAQNPTAADVAAASARPPPPPPPTVGSKRGRGSDKAAAAAAASAADEVPAMAEALSKEEQAWLQKVFAIVRACKPDDDVAAADATDAAFDARKAGDKQEEDLVSVLRVVATDSATYPYSPYLAQFVTAEVNANLRCLPMLRALMRLVQAMLASSAIDLEPYLHQLLPAVITCVVGKRLSATPFEDHWGLRRLAARVVWALVRSFGDKFADLQPRITKTFHDALCDPKKPLSTQYGALVGIELFGPLVAHSLLIPSLPNYLSQLERLLAPGETDDPMAAASRTRTTTTRLERQGEALRVYEVALQICANYFFRDAGLFSVPSGGAGGGAVAVAAGAPEAAAEPPRRLLPELAIDYGTLYETFGPALLQYACASEISSWDSHVGRSLQVFL